MPVRHTASEVISWKATISSLTSTVAVYVGCATVFGRRTTPPGRRLRVPEFQYRCRGCNRLFASGERNDVTRCPRCNSAAARVFSFNVTTSMREHWNTAVGEYVSNSREMSDSLKRKSEEMSVRTGIDHDYQYVSPAEMADPSAHGASRENLEETNRRFHDLSP